MQDTHAACLTASFSAIMRALIHKAFSGVGSQPASQPACVLCAQEREESGLSEWDRFARAEYVRLAVEEEGDDSPHSSWTQAVEAAL
jgi:hypothetical protein